VDVIVPLEVRELFSLSLETRKSVIVGVTIGVMNKKRIPLVIIVLDSQYMESWYRNRTLTGKELVLLSFIGFINDDLAIEWLEHFIKHSSAGLDFDDWILFLYDNCGSYWTP
jgi:hypothetical protein